MSTSIEDALYEISRYLDKPLWKATQFLSSSGTVYKVVGAVAAVFALPGTILSRIIQHGTNAYFQKHYLSWKNNTAKAEERAEKFMTWNVCMMPGGFPTWFGGMSQAGDRIQSAAQFIKDQKADVVCLQEMMFDPATQLMSELKDTYRYFYYRIGPNPWGMENGLFWASKVPLETDPIYVPFDVPNMQKGFHRGFFVAELQGRYVISTHLDPTNGDVRAQQIQAILDYKKTLNKPIILIGDLNIEPEDTAANNLLQTDFANFNTKNVTCHGNTIAIDHILTNEKCSSIIARAFDPSNLPAALSDHHAVVLTLHEKNKA